MGINTRIITARDVSTKTTNSNITNTSRNANTYIYAKMKRNAGITLIALVITIIIIIILATITINFAFGDNGLINMAELARDEAANSTDYESNARANLVAYMNEFIADLNGVGNEEPENPNPPEPTYPTEVEGVTIPDGFYYVGGTKDEGIVISDEEADAGKGVDHASTQNLIGNQFVWIPVEDDSLFERYDGYRNGSKQTYVSSGNATEPFASGYSTEESEYNAMVSSVLDHNGFYVGRYEAGTTNSSRNEDSGINDAVYVKQNLYAYNYVGWSNSNDMTNENGGAVELAKGFASVNGYTSVTSTLIYGIQWDAVMNFIDPTYATGSCAEDSFVRDSSGKGWYSQSAPTTTGSDENFAVKNIYDLGGNVYEWTMEAFYTNSSGRVYRGGNFLSSGSSGPASIRSYNYPSNANDRIGFRLALYL